MKSLKVIVPILALLAIVLFYWPEQPSYIPQKLWGVWQTDYDRYADRHLDISEAIFTIGQGQEKIQVFFIKQVKMTPAGQRERYTFHYRAHGETKDALQTFTFYYEKTDEDERLQLENQDDIHWYRVTDLGTPALDPEATAP